jgi:hypothetical protein
VLKALKWWSQGVVVVVVGAVDEVDVESGGTVVVEVVVDVSLLAAEGATVVLTALVFPEPARVVAVVD